jgi:hypothetical protein
MSGGLTMDRESTLSELDSTLEQSLGHVNLHYRAGDGDAAARLLEVLGLIKTEELPLPNGTMFYRFTTNRHDLDRGDGIVYLGQVPAALAGVYAVIRERLGVGTAAEHPSVAALQAAQAQDPEHNFHTGFLMNTLEQIEVRMEELKRLEQTDPRFKGRLHFLVNRAMPGHAAFDARLDASPLYSGVTRYTFGRNGVQAFVETDLFVSGPLGGGLVFELDYVLPGERQHILSRTELTR